MVPIKLSLLLLNVETWRRLITGQIVASEETTAPYGLVTVSYSFT